MKDFGTRVLAVYMLKREYQFLQRLEIFVCLESIKEERKQIKSHFFHLSFTVNVILQLRL